MTKKTQTTPEHVMLWGRVSLPRLTQYDFDSVKESWTNTNMAHTESQRHLIFWQIMAALWAALIPRSKIFFLLILHSIPAASMAGLQALANVAATARVAYEMIQNSATGCVLRFGSFDQAQRVLGFALQPILAGHNASRSGLDSASIRNEPSTVESMSTWFDLESFSPVQSSHCHSVSFESLHECWAQGKMWWEWERIARKTDSWCFDWSFPTSHPQLLMISKSDHMFLGYILSYCYYVEVAVEGAKFTCDETKLLFSIFFFPTLKVENWLFCVTFLQWDSHFRFQICLFKNIQLWNWKGAVVVRLVCDSFASSGERLSRGHADAAQTIDSNLDSGLGYFVLGLQRHWSLTLFSCEVNLANFKSSVFHSIDKWWRAHDCIFPAQPSGLAMEHVLGATETNKQSNGMLQWMICAQTFKQTISLVGSLIWSGINQKQVAEVSWTKILVLPGRLALWTLYRVPIASHVPCCFPSCSKLGLQHRHSRLDLLLITWLTHGTCPCHVIGCCRKTLQKAKQGGQRVPRQPCHWRQSEWCYESSCPSGSWRSQLLDPANVCSLVALAGLRHCASGTDWVWKFWFTDHWSVWNSDTW